MTNEEIQRTMEFILQGQARFDARMEKDEARIARLEDAFVTLVETARITDERQDKTDQRVDTLARLEEAFVTLVEIARMTDERQDVTDRRVSESEEKFAVLVDAQVLSEAKFAALAEAQAHTDRRLKTLIDVVER